MKKQSKKPSTSSLDPKLRTIAEAAYLVNPEQLIKYGKKKNTLEENYKNTINKGTYFNSLKEQKYVFFDIADNKKDGFYAVSLLNYSGEMLISIRGTDFSNFNILQMAFDDPFGRCGFITNITAKIISDDLYSDLQIAFGKIPNQYKSAEAFVDGLMKVHPRGKMIITGHSLGGLLAQLISAKFGIKTTVFDSPGAKKTIERLVGDDFDLQKIKIINDLPNFINTRGEHVKTPIAVNNGGILALKPVRNFLGTIPHKSGKKAKYLLSHGMEDILNSINKNGIFEKIPIKIWPKNGLSFYTSMEAYNAMPAIYDRYIYQMWEKQYKYNSLDKDSFPADPLFCSKKYKNTHGSEWLDIANSVFYLGFRTKYPNFELYKSDFLKYGLIKDES